MCVRPSLPIGIVTGAEIQIEGPIPTVVGDRIMGRSRTRVESKGGSRPGRERRVRRAAPGREPSWSSKANAPQQYRGESP